MLSIGFVFSDDFRPYGRPVAGYDLADLIAALRRTPCPDEGVLYQPSEPSLEALPVAQALQDRFYGGMPIQIGYCSGHNGALNCLEYHRDSEINVFATDVVLLVAKEWELADGTLSTTQVRAFRAPAGTAVELYATTLHYAPCCPRKEDRFQAAIILPRGTNTARPAAAAAAPEDRLLWAKNKWLIAHPDAPEAAEGACIGLMGENLRLW